MTKREQKIEKIGSLIAEEGWKGKYQSESGFKDIVIDAMNAGYNLAKSKFKKVKRKSRKKEFIANKLPAFPYALLGRGKTISLEEIKE